MNKANPDSLGSILQRLPENKGRLLMKMLTEDFMNKHTKHIALTNDDGIRSPGLRTVVETALTLGKVTVIAPSSQQTSSGRSFKGDKKEYFRCINYFKVNGIQIKAYHCDCSPARVVLHAFDVLFNKKKPDLLISGINYGENLGSNITISGTVGAAIEAASWGVPALALSLQTHIKDHFNHPEREWEVAKYFTHYFAKLMLNKKMPAGVDILNVNIPTNATINTPWKLTTLSRQPYFANKVKNPNPRSKIGDAKCSYGFDKKTLEPDSDILAFTKGMISVTPLSLDMTARGNLSHKHFEL